MRIAVALLIGNATAQQAIPDVVLKLQQRNRHVEQCTKLYIDTWTQQRGPLSDAQAKAEQCVKDLEGIK
jgi:hypothetical protein